MNIPVSTSLLPEGVRTWGAHDWPVWDFPRFQSEVQPLLQAWEQLDAEERQERLLALAQNAAIVLRLTGLKSFHVTLMEDRGGEGFEWLLQEKADLLPWVWGNKPVFPALPLVEGAPMTELALWEHLQSLSLANDATGAVHTLAWFACLTAFLCWWDCRLTGRLSAGLLFEGVTVDGHTSVDTTATGRRFGPSLFFV